MSDDLLEHYRDQPLISPYDVYQHLMDYWSDVMQDDVYQIAVDGWVVNPERILVKDRKGKEKDKGWTCDLVPKELIVARYFADRQAEIDDLRAELEYTSAQRTELEEEHGGDDGLLSELEKINKASVTARLKEIDTLDEETQDELEVLDQWMKFSTQEARLKKLITQAEAELDGEAYEKYPELTEDEVKTLVVDDKWLTRLDADVHGEMDRISQSLTQRVKELAERYEAPLPQLSDCVADLEDKVNGHLERMGFGVTEPKLAEVGT